MKTLRCAAVVVVSLFVVSCTEKGTPAADHKVLTPKAGQCISKEIKDLDDLAPDFTTVVDCTEPHVYEVVDVIDVPKRFLEGKTKAERRANRTELATVAGESVLKAKFERFAWDGCRPATLEAVGLSKLQIAGKPASESGAYLLMGGALNWLNLTPGGNWIDGDTKLVCSIRFTEHIITTQAVGPKPVRAASKEPAYTDFLTADFPVGRRQCMTYDDKGRRSLLACDKPHYGEMFFSFDAQMAFGEKFVKSIDITDPTKAQWEQLSAPCSDALPQLLGDGYDDGLEAVAEPVPGGWDDESNYYLAHCLVVPKQSEEFDLPGGSLIGNAEDVEFVPFTPNVEV